MLHISTMPFDHINTPEELTERNFKAAGLSDHMTKFTAPDYNKHVDILHTSTTPPCNYYSNSL